MTQIENKPAPSWSRFSEKKLDKLVRQLSNPDIKVVTTTAIELNRYAKAFPAKSGERLVEYLTNPAHQPIRQYLADALRIGFTTERFQPTLELLWHTEKEVRDFAARILEGGLR